MKLPEISGSEALGKQEGTSASPVLGRNFRRKEKGAAKSNTSS